MYIYIYTRINIHIRIYRVNICKTCTGRGKENKNTSPHSAPTLVLRPWPSQSSTSTAPGKTLPVSDALAEPAFPGDPAVRAEPFDHQVLTWILSLSTEGSYTTGFQKESRALWEVGSFCAWEAGRPVAFKLRQTCRVQQAAKLGRSS